MIPRVLHQVWLGPPMPEHLAAYRARWLELHPSWEHRLWTEANMPRLRNQALYDAAEAVTSSVGQFRSDVARYDLLAAYGGVYADLDMEPLRPIDELLDAGCFAGWELQNVWVNNAILGAEAGHPFLLDLIAGLAANVTAMAGLRPNHLSGPRYVTPVARRHPEVTVHDEAAFYPYGFADVGTARERGPFPTSWCVHHWHNTRANRKPRRPAPPRQYPRKVRHA